MSERVVAVHTSHPVAGRQPQHSSTAVGFADVLQHIIESMPARGERGADLVDPTAALELQARLYRQAEQLEITTRLLDHGIGAVKTILQTRM